MNTLSVEKQAVAVSALVEGASIRNPPPTVKTIMRHA